MPNKARCDSTAMEISVRNEIISIRGGSKLILKILLFIIPDVRRKCRLCNNGREMTKLNEQLTAQYIYGWQYVPECH